MGGGGAVVDRTSPASRRAALFVPFAIKDRPTASHAMRPLGGGMRQRVPGGHPRVSRHSETGLGTVGSLGGGVVDGPIALDPRGERRGRPAEDRGDGPSRNGVVAGAGLCRAGRQTTATFQGSPPRRACDDQAHMTSGLRRLAGVPPGAFAAGSRSGRGAVAPSARPVPGRAWAPHRRPDPSRFALPLIASGLRNRLPGALLRLCRGVALRATSLAVVPHRRPAAVARARRL
jgi:hypothetical protein